MRLNDEEHARLEALAKHHGLAAAALLRMLLRKEEREVFPDIVPSKEPPSPSKTKKKGSDHG